MLGTRRSSAVVGVATCQDREPKHPERESARLLRDSFYPILWRYIPQLDIELTAVFSWEENEKLLESLPPKSGFTGDYAGLLGNLGFENAVTERTALLVQAQRAAVELMAELERSLELLEAERR